MAESDTPRLTAFPSAGLLHCEEEWVWVAGCFKQARLYCSGRGIYRAGGVITVET